VVRTGVRVEHILDIVTATRKARRCRSGCSAALALLDCARSRAALLRRDFAAGRREGEAVVHRVTLAPRPRWKAPPWACCGASSGQECPGSAQRVPYWFG
jgi:hypothetical protein